MNVCTTSNTTVYMCRIQIFGWKLAFFNMIHCLIKLSPNQKLIVKRKEEEKKEQSKAICERAIYQVSWCLRSK